MLADAPASKLKASTAMSLGDTVFPYIPARRDSFAGLTDKLIGV